MSIVDINYYAEGVQSQSSNWLDKSLPAILGILIGFGLNRLYDYIKEQKLIKKSGDTFLLELNLFKEPLSKQIESLNSCIAELESPDFKPIKLTANIPIDQDRFKTIDRLMVYKYFVKLNSNNIEEARKEVNKLYGILKVTEMESERMKSYFENFITLGSAEHKKFNNSINELLRIFSKLRIDIEKRAENPDNDELIKELTPLFELVSSSSDKNLIQITEIFCKPLSHILARFRLDERIETMAINLKICYDCFKEHKSIKESYTSKFKNLKLSFEKRQDEMVQIINKYNL